MKFVILDNTGWTTHFVVLQSTSRAAETASVASRRTTERLVRWTLPTSSRPPFIPIRSSRRLRRHAARTVTNFLAVPLTEIPVRRMREHDAHRCAYCAHPSVRVARCMRRCTTVHARCHILSAAETTTPAGRGRRSSPNGDRCAARANQKVSQSSAPAAAATGAAAGVADAVAGLRAGIAAAMRFGGASRSSRAAACCAGTATAAAGARDA